ncbi:hypothetical protein K353_06568 [Kitasatospora sp. SolWspMP-SS2h]|nr:hypothetical protein K353_06568 [Kitasatospora sp. SolWspMP-SS2h]
MLHASWSRPGSSPALLIQRVLYTPPKRFDKRNVTFLTGAEIDALLAAPDPQRWES